MTFFSEPPIFVGAYVTVEPMEMAHAKGLFQVGADADIWRWLPESEFFSEADAQDFIRRALLLKATGAEFPFVVVERASGRIAGTTRYLEISDSHRSLEIGWTWYGREFQRTPVNTECKLLLMQHAFEVLGAVRLQFKTDSRNLRSQTAIQRLGACLEGTLRNHRTLGKDGFIRDSVYFSVIDTEWPVVKTRLQRMLNSQKEDQVRQ